MDLPRFEVENAPGATVLRVIGDVGWPHEETALQQALRRLVQAAGEDTLAVVDLGQLTDICADGCGILFGASVKARERNVRLCLAAVPPYAAQRLERTGLLHFVSVYPSVAAALETLQPEEALRGGVPTLEEKAPAHDRA